MWRVSVQSSQEWLVYFWLWVTVTIAIHPMSSFPWEAQDRLCSQPLAFQRTLSSVVPNVNLIPGCLLFLQSNFPFTSISSSISSYILYFTYYYKHLKCIFCECGQLIKCRRRERMEKGKMKSITLVLGVEAVVGGRGLNSSEYRLSQAAFIQTIILEWQITTEHFLSLSLDRFIGNKHNKVKAWEER